MWFRGHRHSHLTKEAILASFPEELSEDVLDSLKLLGVSKHEVHNDQSYSSFTPLPREKIPYRVYFPSIHPASFKKCSCRQRAIIASIMSRHHDGFHREIWVRELMQHPETWTVPFVAYALGDYVMEVVTVVEEMLGDEWVALFKNFAVSDFIDTNSLSQRIFTYWDIYYRPNGSCYTWFCNYTSYRVAQQLGVWDKRVAKQLIRRQKRLSSKSM